MIGLALPVADPGAPPSVEAHDAVNPVTALPLAAPGVKLMLSGPVAEVVEPEAKLTADGGAGDPTMTAGEAPMPVRCRARSWRSWCTCTSCLS